MANILVLRNQQQTGPFDAATVRQMLADGRLAPTDLAWREGMAEWKPLAEVMAASPLVPSVPLASSGNNAWKWALGGVALVATLASAGVGVWQYQENKRLAAEKEQLVLQQQRLEDEQARIEEQRRQEEQRRADAEKRRLEEEKRAAEEKNRELEEQLQQERQQAATRERQRERQRQQQLEARQSEPAFPVNNGYSYGTPPPPPPQVAVCRECGIVQTVRILSQEGQGSGVGAIAGGVLGGVLGNQVGRGRGKDAATVVGALGGAYAGHQIEKSQRATNSYEVTVRFDDGMVRSFNTQQAWRQGDRVRMYNGGLVSSGY